MNGLNVNSIIYEDAQLNNIMINQAQKNIALSALEKINTVEPYYVCPVTGVDAIITETDPNDAALIPYKHLGIEVL